VLSPHAGEMLSFSAKREMLVALHLPWHNSATDTEARHFSSGTRQYALECILPSQLAAVSASEALQLACRALQLQPSAVLCVSSSNELLAAAALLPGMHTCRFADSSSSGSSGSAASAHYQARALEDVRWLVEDVNGVSYKA
jgi:hypothetical protein